VLGERRLRGLALAVAHADVTHVLRAAHARRLPRRGENGGLCRRRPAASRNPSLRRGAPGKRIPVKRRRQRLT
jgi:hypothetical protein